MTSVPIYNVSGKRVGKIDANEESLGSRVNADLLKHAVVISERNHRRGTASTKERGEIKGTTRKPWRQKGTGNARAGSKKSPVWRGGGTIFGPRPRDYSVRVSKKTKRGALKSALLLRLKEGQIKAIRGLKLAEPKTKELHQMLKQMDAGKNCLLVVAEFDKKLWLSARNIPSVEVVTADGLDARRVAARTNIVVAEDAMTTIGIE
ncbi:unnamed protein product [marine sediment metagenome]|uniref:50S ribosomal protein L4 n=1 Tax=marine sediment metagenome TaxID=412755 RepID=X0W4L1_9ZZZZ